MNLNSFGGYLSLDGLFFSILFMAIIEGKFVKLILLYFDPLSLQYFLINFLQMFLMLITEQYVIIILIGETVERQFMDKYFLQLLLFCHSWLIFLDEVVAVFCIVVEEEIERGVVVEDGVVYFLVVELIG